jgi:mono/diheme cytochrome c family protein
LGQAELARWFVLSFLLFVVGSPAWAEEQPETAQRGLLATLRDPGEKDVVAIMRLEPTIAVSWKLGESGHSRLKADGGTVVWKGWIHLARKGNYCFSVRLRGVFRLTVAGKEVLKAEAHEAVGSLNRGAEIPLEAGDYPILAVFQRLPGLARVEVRWQGPAFREEPLPQDVLGHRPSETPARFAADSELEHGRFLAEELSCLKCHQADDSDKIAAGLANRPSPDLSQVGRRAYAGWIERWLESPRQLRPDAVMPELFSADQAGQVERRAVAAYLASLGGPVKNPGRTLAPLDHLSSLLRGQVLYKTTGCVACHREPPSGLGSKTTPEMLALYLSNPLSIDPGGRMPHMQLNEGGAVDLARFLCFSVDRSIRPNLSPPRTQLLPAVFARIESRPEERAAFEKLPAGQKWLDLGKRLVIEKGCNNCHTIAPDGKPFAAMQANADWSDLRKPARHRSGCLADAAEKRGQAPWFALESTDRAALRAFLKEGTTGAGAKAESYSARVDLKRFQCLACHRRDGEGGLLPEQTEQLRFYEKMENPEMIEPPPLTGLGHKLRTSWLRTVLVDGGRARPWLALRMPRYGPDQVGKLVEGLTALDGAELDDTVYKPASTPAKIESGRYLVGKNAFGCIACHDLAGIPSTGTRGPDLAASPQRVRYDWYLRWLEQPGRMVPGTRMPAVFISGKSPVEKVFDGNAEAQAEAMWSYLSLGDKLPPPVGMEPPPGRRQRQGP